MRSPTRRLWLTLRLDRQNVRAVVDEVNAGPPAGVGLAMQTAESQFAELRLRDALVRTVPTNPVACGVEVRGAGLALTLPSDYR